MKLILSTEQNQYYYCHFKGGDLIIVQRYDGVEHTYTMSEAIRLGIVQFDKDHGRTIVGTSWFLNQPSITEYRRF